MKTIVYVDQTEYPNHITNMLKCFTLLMMLVVVSSLKAQSDGAPKAGDVSPNAIVIDADEIFPFNHGVAIVKKGKASALINTKGEFIIPYNVNYNIEYVEGSEGLFPVLSNKVGGNLGYINYKGKFFDIPGGYALTDDKRYGTWGMGNYIDVDGKRYTIPGSWSSVREGLGVARENLFSGFKNIHNQFVVKPIYKIAMAFSDGAAIVSNPDEFGTIKYGFVDTSGNVIVPLMFSTQPSSFSDGMAKVRPKDQSEFYYAYINKKGEVIIKQTLSDLKKNGGGNGFGDFSNGYAYNGKYVMDKTGKVMLQTELLASFGVISDFPAIQNRMYVKNKIVFSQKGTFTNAVLGYINLENKKIVGPIFNFTPKHPLFFDPFSKLSYAEVPIGKDETKRLIVRQGYINEDGIFVIVKGEAGSKW